MMIHYLLLGVTKLLSGHEITALKNDTTFKHYALFDGEMTLRSNQFCGTNCQQLWGLKHRESKFPEKMYGLTIYSVL